MPLNTSIPLAVQSVDLAGIQTNALNQQNARQAQEMNKLRFQEEQRKNALLEQQQRGELAKQEAVRNVFSQSIDPTTGQPDMQKVRNALYQIDPQMAMGIEKNLTDTQLTQAKAEHEKNKTAQEQISYGANMLQGANAENYAAVRAQIIKMGPELDRVLPQQFDPAAVSRVVQGAMTMKDKLALRNQEIGQQLTMRGQDLSAATARRGQDMSAATAMRGQDLRPQEAGGPVDYVAGSSPWVEDQAKALVEAKIPYPSTRGLNDPQWKAVIERARQLDPSFNAATYAQRAATVKAYTVGTQGKSATALNTGVQHLADYLEAVDKIGGTQFRDINALTQNIKGRTGDTDLARVASIRPQLATELEKAYLASGGTKADRQKFYDLLDPASSPEQRRVNIRTIGTLLQGQLHSLEENYQQGMGGVGGDFSLLKPSGQKAFDKITGGTAPRPAQNSGPSVVKSDADFAALPSGAEFVDQNGKKWKKP